MAEMQWLRLSLDNLIAGRTLSVCTPTQDIADTPLKDWSECLADRRIELIKFGNALRVQGPPYAGGEFVPCNLAIHDLTGKAFDGGAVG